MLSSTAFALVSLLPDDAVTAWGWRIPFLFSAVLIVLGLFIRARIEETPAFRELQSQGRTPQLPVVEAARDHWREIALTIGLYVSAGVPFYIVSVFVLSYGTGQLGMPRSMLLTGMLVAAVVEAATVPLFGLLSDRLGRRPVFLAGAAFTLLFAFPFFWLLGTGTTAGVVLAMLLALGVGHAAMYGPTAALYAELFGPRVRYTGTSVGYQLGGVVAGFVPLVTGALVASAGGASWPIAVIWAAAAAIGLGSAVVVRETRSRDLTTAPVPAAEPA